MKLLRQMGKPGAGQFFPVNNLEREAFVAATQQATGEHDQIHKMADSLRNLTPTVMQSSMTDYA